MAQERHFSHSGFSVTPDSLGAPEGAGYVCFACSGVTPETAGDGWKEDILQEDGLPADIRQP